jgi:hypothetical protein
VGEKKRKRYQKTEISSLEEWIMNNPNDELADMSMNSFKYRLLSIMTEEVRTGGYESSIDVVATVCTIMAYYICWMSSTNKSIAAEVVEVFCNNLRSSTEMMCDELKKGGANGLSARRDQEKS